MEIALCLGPVCPPHLRLASEENWETKAFGGFQKPKCKLKFHLLPKTLLPKILKNIFYKGYFHKVVNLRVIQA